MIRGAILTYFLLLGLLVQADEELWLPMDLNDSLLQELGVELGFDYHQFYSDTAVSLTQAVVQFGGGCTGVVVSKQGLLLTNQHCARYYIQNHSSVDHNLLRDGFWAKSLEEEKRCRGLSVTQILGQFDVTDSILTKSLRYETPPERARLIRENIARCKVRLKTNACHSIEVKSFEHGTRYVAFIEQVHRDVRLVANPPESLASFGGDLDNWMWPRHSADFAFFRIYADSSNRPADAGAGIRPWISDQVIKLSDQRAEVLDSTVVVGYPWNSSNYLPGQALKMIVQQELPWKVKLRAPVLGLLQDSMMVSDVNYLRLAARKSTLSNGYKKWQGQIEGMTQAGGVDKRTQQLIDLRSNLSLNSAEQLDSLLKEYEAHYQNFWPIYRQYLLFNEFRYSGSELLKMADKYRNYFETFPNGGGDFKGMLRSYHERSLPGLEAQIIKQQWEVILAETTPEFRSKHKAVFVSEKHMNRMVDKTFIVDTVKVFVRFNRRDNQSFERFILKDKFMSWSGAYEDEIHANLMAKLATLSGKSRALHQALDAIWIEGLEGKKYHDANGTIRVNFGQVEGYVDRGQVEHDPFTTIQGLVAKNETGEQDYELSDSAQALVTKLLATYTGNLCFIASHHTSGGNSGSPVLNYQGELVGLNFDRAWESTMSDLWFDPAICRNISTDIHYIVAILRASRMDHLVREIVGAD